MPDSEVRAPRPRSRWFRFTVWLGGIAIAWTLRLLGPTWRIRSEGDDIRLFTEPFLAATWHGGLFAAGFHFRDRGIAILVSQSRDGDRVDAVLTRLGFARSPRGSSSRGGAEGIRSMLDIAASGGSLGVLCDGPRGPRHVVKPGVLSVGRSTGRVVQTVGMAAAPALRFPSWDQAFVPLPFARVAFTYGETIAIAPDASEDEFAATLAKLQAALEASQRRAEELAAVPPAALSARGRA